jgi:predicted DNA-binding transcriptional regulator AlpA
MDEAPAPVMAVAEIARFLGVSSSRVRQLMSAADFPVPLAELSVGRVWATDDIRSWAKSNGRVIAGGS